MGRAGTASRILSFRARTVVVMGISVKVSLFGTSSVEGERTLRTIVFGFGTSGAEESPSISDLEEESNARSLEGSERFH